MEALELGLDADASMVKPRAIGARPMRMAHSKGVGLGDPQDGSKAEPRGSLHCIRSHCFID